ncbi:MAG: hypothetical protein WA667_11045 [Candidatus Nitrosopolaris sp.]
MTNSITSTSLSRKTLNENTQFLYLHRFFFGGVTTFTAHLFHTLGIVQKVVLRPSNKSESKLRDFGYGLCYRNISNEAFPTIKYPFLTVIKDDYFHALAKLNDKRRRLDNIVLVIHDPRDISDRMIPIIRKYKIITIRRTVQDFLMQKYNLDSLFLHHPFYPYPVISKNPKIGAVSISRIGFGKNIDIILKANRHLSSQQSIKLYGCPTRIYVYLYLGGKKGDFNKFYYGKFDRSFESVSNTIAQVKFVVDLSVVKHDGGGTQYTFLEAIHNDCALILHRRWLESVTNDHRDFKENYNCLAVENENELAELIRKDPDTTKLVHNAKKLMHRHTNINWAQLIDNN